MPSNWIQHAKNYASQHNITYKEALKLSKPSYSKYGVVTTEPSQIKLNLNEDQYSLTAFKINPAFRKGDKTTHNVNIKYKSDELIDIGPKTIIKDYIPLEEYIPQNIQQKNITIKKSSAPQIYSELATPIFSPYGVSENPSRKKKVSLEHQTLEKPPAYKNLKPSYTKFEKVKRPAKRLPTTDKAKQQKEQEQMGMNDFNISSKPKNKFIINESKHKKNIQKIVDKYNKIKNTNMSKYLDKKPITPKPIESMKNDGFSFLYEPPNVEIPKVSFSAPFNKLIYDEGIIPYTNIIIPNYKSPDEYINILNDISIKYQNLKTVLMKSKMPAEDKEILINDCQKNIFSLTDKILKIQQENKN